MHLRREKDVEYIYGSAPISELWQKSLESLGFAPFLAGWRLGGRALHGGMRFENTIMSQRRAGIGFTRS